MRCVPLFILPLVLVGCGGSVKRCLVSPLEGTIVLNGEPVASARITRRYHSHWYKEHVETVAHTDTNGSFQFDGAWKKASVNVMHQPVIEELVEVEYKGKTYTVLKVTKMNYHDLGELREVQDSDPAHGKERLIKRDGKLYLKFDLNLDKVPVGRPQ